jgi:hypothetical protein
MYSRYVQSRHVYDIESIMGYKTTYIYICTVGIATGYGLNVRGVGVRVPVWSRMFSSPRRPYRLWGPPNLLSNVYRGVKQQGREADYSPPTSAEVKKMWIYSSTPPYAFMA